MRNSLTRRSPSTLQVAPAAMQSAMHNSPIAEATDDTLVYTGTLLSVTAYNQLTAFAKLIAPRTLRCGIKSRKIAVRLDITRSHVCEYLLLEDGSRGQLLASIARDYIGFALLRVSASGRCRFILSDNSGTAEETMVQRVFEVSSRQELSEWSTKLALGRPTTETMLTSSVQYSSVAFRPYTPTPECDSLETFDMEVISETTQVELSAVLRATHRDVSSCHKLEDSEKMLSHLMGGPSVMTLRDYTDNHSTGIPSASVGTGGAQIARWDETDGVGHWETRVVPAQVAMAAELEIRQIAEHVQKSTAPASEPLTAKLKPHQGRVPQPPLCRFPTGPISPRIKRVKGRHTLKSDIICESIENQRGLANLNRMQARISVLLRNLGVHAE
ncbi:hypothetical protein DFJ77DRAFT_506718 [Powellomyces hirtus]|nr:hypothetical protein DFJ77DRAFT_506718 [Powellomyces hirtus]